eukprot:1044456-Pyramimonas_sp.AAC.1
MQIALSIRALRYSTHQRQRGRQGGGGVRGELGAVHLEALDGEEGGDGGLQEALAHQAGAHVRGRQQRPQQLRQPRQHKALHRVRRLLSGLGLVGSGSG